MKGSHCNVTNSSISNSYSDSDGGAIYSTGSYSNVYYSNFTNNVANFNGGAVYWFGGANSIHNTVLGSTFVNNTALANGAQSTKGGGAIYWSEKGSYGTIKDSKFINNYVETSTQKADGGAVLWDTNTHCLIDNCTFDGNHIKGAAKDWVQGGSIYFRSNNVTVSNSLFKNSWSSQEGGALYIANDKRPAAFSPIDIHIINTTFINNTAKAEVSASDHDYGGGAILIKQVGNIYLTNVTFINNTANRGGALSMLKPNKGDNNYFTNCTFIGNKATENGGSIWAGNKDWTLRLTNVLISDSKAGALGGGIYTNHNINYNNLTFINNTANSGGGLYWDKSSVTIQNIKFINNTASENGGAVYVPQNNTKVMNNNFTNNSALNGGAIYVGASNVVITKNNFTNNSAERGGAIYTSNKVIGGSISSSYFNQNRADYGGAIYAGSLGDENTHIPISDCTFIKNVANFNGGAVYVANSYYDITSGYFEGNNASNGGAVYVATGLSGIKIKDSTFKNSYVSKDGGAIYHAGPDLTLTIENDTFIQNIARYNGGAILYVTTAMKYRDYNNFDTRGVITSGRTDVDSIDGTHFIVSSLFENNSDYIFEVEAVSNPQVPTIRVILQRPRDSNRDTSIYWVVNLTNNDDSSVPMRQEIVTAANYYDHYNAVYDYVYVNFEGLRQEGNYTINVGFYDNNYMYKENSTNATAHGNLIGGFKLLQSQIQGNISEQYSQPFYEMHLEDSYTFTIYDDPNAKSDDRCMNLTNLDKPLIIYGNGWALDAKGYSRIFNVTSNNVTFINVRFLNGNASGQYNDTVDKGGALFWAGANGKLINCSLVENHAERGGGLYLNESASNYIITDCKFRQNDADLFGGAIDCYAPKMNLTYTLFDQNTADTGAALCREITATGGFGDYNNFTSNKAKTNGSALAWISAEKININHF